MKLRHNAFWQCSLSCCFILLVTPAVATAGLPKCQPLLTNNTLITAPAGASDTVPKQVSLALVPGQLKPQIQRLLTEKLAIKVLDWQASPHHQWPTEHTLTAGTWAELLRRVLKPYQLQLVMYPNHSAVVRYQDAG